MKDMLQILIIIVGLYILFTHKQTKNSKYDILTTRVENVVVVDKEIEPYIINIFREIKRLNTNNKIDTNIFKYEKLYNIEKISYAKENELSDNIAAITYIWTINKKNRTRIILNPSLKNMPTYYVYAVILHEIGHASYNFKHYDKQLDIMNSKCNIKASEFHQILDSFYMNPYKYKNIN